MNSDTCRSGSYRTANLDIDRIGEIFPEKLVGQQIMFSLPLTNQPAVSLFSTFRKLWFCLLWRSKVTLRGSGTSDSQTIENLMKLSNLVSRNSSDLLGNKKSEKGTRNNNNNNTTTTTTTTTIQQYNNNNHHDGQQQVLQDTSWLIALTQLVYSCEMSHVQLLPEAVSPKEAPLFSQYFHIIISLHSLYFGCLFGGLLWPTTVALSWSQHFFVEGFGDPQVPKACPAGNLVCQLKEMWMCRCNIFWTTIVTRYMAGYDSNLLSSPHHSSETVAQGFLATKD